jgi:hypothetical protein
MSTEPTRAADPAPSSGEQWKITFEDTGFKKSHQITIDGNGNVVLRQSPDKFWTPGWIEVSQTTIQPSAAIDLYASFRRLKPLEINSDKTRYTSSSLVGVAITVQCGDSKYRVFVDRFRIRHDPRVRDYISSIADAVSKHLPDEYHFSRLITAEF